MTRQKSFKRLVRMRMEKTGESYTAARATLLAAEEPKAADGPVLTMSDEAIRRSRSGNVLARTLRGLTGEDLEQVVEVLGRGDGHGPDAAVDPLGHAGRTLLGALDAVGQHRQAQAEVDELLEQAA